MSYYERVPTGDSMTTQGRTITEADVANFAGVSGDFNALHTDAERMAESEYGERIAHGALIFSVMTGLLWQRRSEEERQAVVAFYGLDAVRFTAPTGIGDTIHVETTVTEKEPIEHPEATGIVHYDADVVNQDGTTVLYAEPITLMA
ncbi:MAG: MaoC/PaaZ C-terminal domain-containing protein [Halanaeroarchaeum sp.]